MGASRLWWKRFVEEASFEPRMENMTTISCSAGVEMTSSQSTIGMQRLAESTWNTAVNGKVLQLLLNMEWYNIVTVTLTLDSQKWCISWTLSVFGVGVAPL